VLRRLAKMEFLGDGPGKPAGSWKLADFEMAG